MGMPIICVMRNTAPAPVAPPKPKLSPSQRARVRELMTDEGQSRAEAAAWVLAFEVGQ